MKAILFIPGLMFVAVAQAQFSYYKTSIGLSYGYTRYYGDISSQTPLKPVIIAGCSYRPLPGIHLHIEYHAGRIQGGDSLSDPNQRFFQNLYRALFINAKIYGPLKGIYIGAGAGLLMNRITAVKRTRLYPSGKVYVFPGKNRSSDIALQLLAGTSYFFKDRWQTERYAISFGYQFIFTNGDGLDGYNDPPLRFENNNHDLFTVMSIGLSYFLPSK